MILAIVLASSLFCADEHPCGAGDVSVMADFSHMPPSAAEAEWYCKGANAVHRLQMIGANRIGESTHFTIHLKDGSLYDCPPP